MIVQISLNKVYEKVLAMQVTDTNVFNDRLSDYLTAYRKGHSCEIALILLTDKWCNTVNIGSILDF